MAASNSTYDTFEVEESLSQGQVLAKDTGQPEGMSFQQLFEGGPIWENLIKHPAWFDKIVRFAETNEPEDFDRHQGPSFIVGRRLIIVLSIISMLKTGEYNF